MPTVSLCSWSTSRHPPITRETIPLSLAARPDLLRTFRNPRAQPGTRARDPHPRRQSIFRPRRPAVRGLPRKLRKPTQSPTYLGSRPCTAQAPAHIDTRPSSRLRLRALCGVASFLHPVMSHATMRHAPCRMEPCIMPYWLCVAFPHVALRSSHFLFPLPIRTFAVNCCFCCGRNQMSGRQV